MKKKYCKLSRMLLVIVMIITCHLNVTAQGGTVTGRVTDVEGLPMPGVNVIVKGTTKGTITNIDGNYSLDVPANAEAIQFSFIGMKLQEVIYTGQTQINMTMLDDAQGLEEVMVVGFGKQKKASVIGSINTVKPQDLKMPTSSLSTTLAGRLAGVISVQRSGEPGADGADFWIRGVSTFGANKSPLMLVDGVEVSSGDFNDIDPENIASFSILKDATATAIYGVRGANGVVLITTKTGKVQEKASISVRAETSFTQPTQIADFADGVTYMKMYNEAVRMRDPLAPAKFSKEKIAGTEAGLDPYVFPNVDWYNTLFKDMAQSQRANMNVTGGGKKAQYFLSASFFHDSGVLKKDNSNTFDNNINIKRYNLRNNITVNLTPTTKVDLKLSANLEDYNGPVSGASSLFGNIMESNPVSFPIMFPNNGDDYVYFGNKSGGFFGGRYINPYAEMVKGYKERFASTLISNLSFEQKLDFVIKGLSANGLISFKNWSTTSINRSIEPFYFEVDNYSYNQDTKSYDYTLRRVGSEGRNTLDYDPSNASDRRMYIQTSLNYARTFDKHDVAGMLLYNQDEYVNGSPGSDDFYGSLAFRNQGLAGRFTYSFDNRYFGEFNFGYNGSENFIEGKRFGFFPSYAAGYIISNENYFASLKETISLLKMRVSYGLVGNDQIGYGRFPYLTQVNLSNGDYQYTFGDNYNNTRYGVSIDQYGNVESTWEVGRKLNIGLELGLFNDVMIQADVFKEVRDGIFMQRETVPSTVGIGEARPFANIGKVENKGFDASIEYNKVFGDLVVSAKGNFTYSTNKVLAIDEPDQLYPYASKVGHPINQLWGLQAEHLFIDQEQINNSPGQTFGPYLPGDIKYTDVSKEYDGQDRIDVNDMVPMGHPTVPEIVYGFGSYFKYKNVDFSLFFQGISRVSFFLNNIHPFAQNERNVLQAVADDYWNEETQNIHAFYPRLSDTENANNGQNSSWWLRDGSFLRLKNVELGYTYKKARFFANGTNLLTFSKFDMWDPEMGGGNGLGYPPQRVINIGVQVKL
ncbi:SusC/RagA family TonB-linked outer membrane protein [Carboxylicivirga marina]|uniref:TonB-dependent receptor n=1 Tax=Carboxylicivirga marina TaxID=2800988 RepID=A0ABS1HG65_9BACT|nr:TonB-dependent receptor [Carboxylicivirga marina]MBK3516184.1 TonB-dependent receptor [Carboxylicivirga marina]